MRKAKNHETPLLEYKVHIPWRRDKSGRPIEREPEGTCCICGKIIYYSTHPNRKVTCGLCVQIFMGLNDEDREKFRRRMSEE